MCTSDIPCSNMVTQWGLPVTVSQGQRQAISYSNLWTLNGSHIASGKAGEVNVWNNGTNEGFYLEHS